MRVYASMQRRIDKIKLNKNAPNQLVVFVSPFLGRSSCCIQNYFLAVEGV